MSCGDDLGNVVCGHLNEATVSVTCEMFIRIIDGEVGRFKDEETGINLFKFF
jgi:predicted DNA-binding protein with PD1-like motif